MPTWTVIGRGSFNTVYLSEDKKLVLKRQIKTHSADDNYDTPERSVRLWNQLNPDLNPSAYVLQDDQTDGWVCPFVDGTQASDRDMRDALIGIYNRTGRIIVDAFSHKNFVKEKATGKVICVDIGMALQLEQQENAQFAEMQRSGSFTSRNAWKTFKGEYKKFFNDYEKTYPETISIIKSLLLINVNRPDIFDVGFLKGNKYLVAMFADNYNRQERNPTQVDRLRRVVEQEERKTARLKDQSSVSNLVTEELLQARDINLENIKESCMVELKRYIGSRGSTDVMGSFTPKFWSFRSSSQTINKVQAARRLIAQVEIASSYHEIQTEMMAAVDKNPQLIDATFTSDLNTSLGKCLFKVELGLIHEASKHFESIISPPSN